MSRVTSPPGRPQEGSPVPVATPATMPDLPEGPYGLAVTQFGLSQLGVQPARANHLAGIWRGSYEQYIQKSEALFSQLLSWKNRQWPPVPDSARMVYLHNLTFIAWGPQPTDNPSEVFALQVIPGPQYILPYNSWLPLAQAVVEACEAVGMWSDPEIGA